MAQERRESQVEFAPESLDTLLGSGDAGPEHPTKKQAPTTWVPPRRLAVSLFVLSFLSATVAHLRLSIGAGSLRELASILAHEPHMIRQSLIFSLTLIFLLITHEVGHALSGIRNRIRLGPPYYIPFPSVFGTLGSIIFLRSRAPNRGVLLRVAVMGPCIGMLAAIPITAYGLTLSTPYAVESIAGGSSWIGTSLLYSTLAHFFSPNGVHVQLHALAFAGWVAMFITSLALIPVCPLDGGHISHALLGRNAWVLWMLTRVALLAWGVYLTLDHRYGEFAGVPWLAWGGLLSVIRFQPASIEREDEKLTQGDGFYGLLSIALLVVTFVPVPVQVVPDNPDDALFIQPEGDWRVEDLDHPPESFQL